MTGSMLAVATPSETELRSRPDLAESPLTTAELADCTCPEFCERDHDID